MTKIFSAAMVAVVLIGAATSAARAGETTLHFDTVGALSADRYTATFHGGEEARVAVVGDGDTELAVFVYNANGNLIDSDRGDKCLLTWTPLWTGKFTIKVVNLGLVANRYGLGVK